MRQINKKTLTEEDIKNVIIKAFIITETIILLFFVCFYLTGCNYEIVDLQYNYDYAIIKLQDGTIIEGNVETWRDYEDGDQLQVRINGVTYLTHSYNCTLIAHNGGEV